MKSLSKTQRASGATLIAWEQTQISLTKLRRCRGRTDERNKKREVPTANKRKELRRKRKPQRTQNLQTTDHSKILWLWAQNVRKICIGTSTGKAAAPQHVKNKKNKNRKKQKETKKRLRIHKEKRRTCLNRGDPAQTRDREEDLRQSIATKKIA